MTTTRRGGGGEVLDSAFWTHTAGKTSAVLVNFCGFVTLSTLENLDFYMKTRKNVSVLVSFLVIHSKFHTNLTISW